MADIPDTTVPQKNRAALPSVSDAVPDLWLDPERWLRAPARHWLERTLQAASVEPRRSVGDHPPDPRPLDELLADLYPREGKRGPVPFAPDPTTLYLAWRARRLITQGFSTEDAFRTLTAKYGPAAKLPGRPDRVAAKLDDLIGRIRSQNGWTVPPWLDQPITPQVDARRRAERRHAQRRMLTRLAAITERHPGSDEDELLNAALADQRMRTLALSVVPTLKRGRGRPRKGTAPVPVDPSQVEAEIAEALARYLLIAK